MSTPANEARRQKIDELMTEMRLMSSFDSLFSQAVAERVGVHQTDIETMDLLNTLGPMTAGELAERAGLTSGATTRLIDRLERIGYVRRRPHPEDRRCVIIEPAYDNLEGLASLFEPMSETMEALLAEFNDGELDVITRFVRESNARVAKINARLRAETKENRRLHYTSL
jgi:DNA-binding MarR family transcriptional regulator